MLTVMEATGIRDKSGRMLYRKDKVQYTVPYSVWHSDTNFKVSGYIEKTALTDNPHWVIAYKYKDCGYCADLNEQSAKRIDKERIDANSNGIDVGKV